MALIIGSDLSKCKAFLCNNGIDPCFRIGVFGSYIFYYESFVTHLGRAEKLNTRGLTESFITKTRPCNILRYFTAVKIVNFR